MKINNKILKSGFSIPELGIGAWPMWWYRERDYENDDEKRHQCN